MEKSNTELSAKVDIVWAAIFRAIGNTTDSDTELILKLLMARLATRMMGATAEFRDLNSSIVDSLTRKEPE